LNYRLYTFVANHYLSQLQCGLQTAHVVSELSQFKYNTKQREAFDAWAQNDKTIIICGAGNHQGVLDCWAELQRTGIGPGFVAGTLFREDEQSMNGMATACGVIVPECYWNTKFVEDTNLGIQYWEYRRPSEKEGVDVVRCYDCHMPEGQFISHIKKYRLV
jgi:hypothetical protein